MCYHVAKSDLIACHEADRDEKVKEYNRAMGK